MWRQRFLQTPRKKLLLRAEKKLTLPAVSFKTEILRIFSLPGFFYFVSTCVKSDLDQ